MKRFVQAAAVALCMATAMTPAQALVVGTADNGNGIPFGNTGGGSFFQQVYNASSFGSGINISSLSFYTSYSPGGQVRPGSFSLWLSVIPLATDIATFDTSAMIFSDPSFVQVFDGTLPTLANGQLDINLSTAFNYNPAAGHLMLTVRDNGFLTGQGAFFDVDANNGVMNSRFSLFSNNWNQGLVTGFNAVAPVPEPASWALMIGGLGLVGLQMRRRKTAVSFA